MFLCGTILYEFLNNGSMVIIYTPWAAHKDVYAFRFYNTIVFNT